MIRRAAMECDAPGYNKHLSHVHCLGNRLPEEVGSCVHFTTGYGVVRVDLYEDPGLVCHGPDDQYDHVRVGHQTIILG